MCEEMMLKYCTATAARVCCSVDPEADILLSLLVQKAASDRCSHATMTLVMQQDWHYAV